MHPFRHFLPRLLAVIALAATAPAFAQTSPGFANGQVLTAPALNAAFAAKQDYSPDLSALAGLSSMGLITRIGGGAIATTTVTGTVNEISVANGDGVAGVPTLSLPTALTFTGKTVTGGTFSGPTISNGTYNGTVAVGSASNWRTALLLGSAATQNTGTSGATLPFANGTNTWAATQTFSVAPVFTDQSGTRSAIGLGTVATQNIGTSGANVPLMNGSNTWSAQQVIGLPVSAGAATPLRVENTAAHSGTPQVIIALDPSATATASIRALGNASTTASIDLVTQNVGAAIDAVILSGPGAMRLPQYGAGTLTTDASGNVTATSDARLKDVVRPFSRGLADLARMDGPVIFDWKAEKAQRQREGKPVPTYAGWTAQGVEKGVPEAVSTGPDGYKTLSDRAVLATAVNAILELKAANDNLRQEVATLKAQMRALRRRR